MLRIEDTPTLRFDRAEINAATEVRRRLLAAYPDLIDPDEPVFNALVSEVGRPPLAVRS